MMECPNCGSKSNFVINSRKVEMNVFRIRLCKECKKKFYTEEVSIDQEEADYYMAEIKREYRARKKVCINGKDN